MKNNSLIVKVPMAFQVEVEYSVRTVLSDYLGFKISVEAEDRYNFEISLEGKCEKLTVNNDFFNINSTDWLKQSSLPRMPLLNWSPKQDKIKDLLVSSCIPVLFGEPEVIFLESNICINIDIFGSIFFMLSRYEELVTIERDHRDRFPARASVSYKAGFLDRPIVDEYIEILWFSMQKLWPHLTRKERVSNNFISCDVDWPFNPAIYSIKKTIRKAGSLIVNDKSISAASKEITTYFLHKLGLKVQDNYREEISWIMSVNESVGNKVTFYFITHHTSKLDNKENIDSPRMRELFNEIHSRGHEIGIHPGFNTYNNYSNFAKSFKNLKKVFEEESISQPEIGGRQHYLRWDASVTPQLYEMNGLSYDSTLGYADRAGFRCGTCHEFPMFDIKHRKKLNLYQKPLIVMECTIIAKCFEGLGYSDRSLQRFKMFKDITNKYNGTFSLLWHNHHLQTEDDKSFYKELIK